MNSSHSARAKVEDFTLKEEKCPENEGVKWRRKQIANRNSNVRVNNFLRTKRKKTNKQILRKKEQANIKIYHFFSISFFLYIHFASFFFVCTFEHSNYTSSNYKCSIMPCCVMCIFKWTNTPVINKRKELLNCCHWAISLCSRCCADCLQWNLNNVLISHSLIVFGNNEDFLHANLFSGTFIFWFLNYDMNERWTKSGLNLCRFCFCCIFPMFMRSV